MRFILQQLVVLLLLMGLCSLAQANDVNATPAPWIFINTQTLTLSVLQGQETLQTFSGISIGRSGTTDAKQARDGKTPLGTYRISHFIEDSSFERFLGLNYPSVADAKKAFASGRITEEDFARISRAHRQGRLPPQNTALGGHIGIHGVGKGDPVMHAEFNWTSGCVALSNEQLKQLNQWVRIGTRVVIH